MKVENFVLFDLILMIILQGRNSLSFSDKENEDQ